MDSTPRTAHPDTAFYLRFLPLSCPALTISTCLARFPFAPSPGPVTHLHCHQVHPATNISQASAVSSPSTTNMADLEPSTSGCESTSIPFPTCFRSERFHLDLRRVAMADAQSSSVPEIPQSSRQEVFTNVRQSGTDISDNSTQWRMSQPDTTFELTDGKVHVAFPREEEKGNLVRVSRLIVISKDPTTQPPSPSSDQSTEHPGRQAREIWELPICEPKHQDAYSYLGIYRHHGAFTMQDTAGALWNGGAEMDSVLSWHSDPEDFINVAFPNSTVDYVERAKWLHSTRSFRVPEIIPAERLWAGVRVIKATHGDGSTEEFLGYRTDEKAEACDHDEGTVVDDAGTYTAYALVPHSIQETGEAQGKVFCIDRRCEHGDCTRHD